MKNLILLTAIAVIIGSNLTEARTLSELDKLPNAIILDDIPKMTGANTLIVNKPEAGLAIRVRKTE